MDLRKILLLLLPVFCLTGCAWLEKAKETFVQKEVTPVMPGAPPRNKFATNNEQNESHGSIVPASLVRQNGSNPAWTGTGAEPASYNDNSWDEQLANSQVVARVNSEPILAGEILERYGPNLAEARKQATPAQMAMLREQLIQRDIEMHIDSKLLVASLRESIPEENLVMLDEHIDGLFEKEVVRLKKELKVQSRLELAEKLATQGTSLPNLHDAFANQRMAVEFLAAKSKSTATIGRPELLAFYDSHREDYTKPARVKWQEIKLLFAKHGGKIETTTLANTILAKLSSGASFSELAKEHSDGATSTEGGHWGWIQQGSLASKELEAVMFSASLEQLQKHLVENENHFQIVRVVDRNDSFMTPFHEVQDEIREKLGQEARKETAKKVLDKLKKEAEIWTVFDSPEPGEELVSEDQFFAPVQED